MATAAALTCRGCALPISGNMLTIRPQQGQKNKFIVSEGIELSDAGFASYTRAVMRFWEFADREPGAPADAPH